MDRKLKLRPSSQVHSGTYDDQTGRLTLELNGATIAYHGVDPKIPAGLEQADSPGTFFHQNIRPQHKDFSRVR